MSLKTYQLSFLLSIILLSQNSSVSWLSHQTYMVGAPVEVVFQVRFQCLPHVIVKQDNIHSKQCTNPNKYNLRMGVHPQSNKQQPCAYYHYAINKYNLPPPTPLVHSYYVLVRVVGEQDKGQQQA